VHKRWARKVGKRRGGERMGGEVREGSLEGGSRTALVISPNEQI